MRNVENNKNLWLAIIDDYIYLSLKMVLDFMKLPVRHARHLNIVYLEISPHSFMCMYLNCQRGKYGVIIIWLIGWLIIGFVAGAAIFQLYSGDEYERDDKINMQWWWNEKWDGHKDNSVGQFSLLCRSAKVPTPIE